MLVDHADPGGDRVGRRRERDLAAVDDDRALVRLVHAVEGLHQRRLARRRSRRRSRVRGRARTTMSMSLVRDDAGEPLRDAVQLDGVGGLLSARLSAGWSAAAMTHAPGCGRTDTADEHEPGEHGIPRSPGSAPVAGHVGSAARVVLRRRRNRDRARDDLRPCSRRSSPCTASIIGFDVA